MVNNLCYLKSSEYSKIFLNVLKFEHNGKQHELKMLYWKVENLFIGYLVEHPEIMSMGKTLEEFEENLKKVFIRITMDNVPEKINELSIEEEKR